VREIAIVNRSKRSVAIVMLLTLIPLTGQAVLAGETRQEHRPLFGVSLSPRSFEEQDFLQFFDEATTAGQVITWAGDWNELVAGTGAPFVLAELAENFDYVPLVQATFFSQDTGQAVRSLADESTRDDYLEGAAAFAARYQPDYLGFGIEVNVLHAKAPADFADFVAFFPEVAAAVKDVSPDTQVFTVFQLEWMKGLRGGLFGGVNDPAAAQWALLDLFPDADLLAFTSYPGLIYADPADIPAEYYADISAHTDRPIAFTEIGWASDAALAGWESDEAEQAEFVGRFFELLTAADVSAEMIVWAFLYDQASQSPFDSMGLRRADGTARPAWNAWLEQIDG
jgi:hypothetical protein